MLVLLAAVAVNLVDASFAWAADAAPSFEQVIAPLFQAKCGECHGKTVQKAELALHTIE